MGINVYILMAAALAAPRVELSTLGGQAHTGELVRLTAERISLKADGVVSQIAISDVLEIRFPEMGKPAEDLQKTVQMVLVDGSRLSCTSLSATDQQFSIKTPAVGTLQVATAKVANIRFASADGNVDEAWKKLTARTLKQDLLVIKKGDILDHLPGSVGDIDEKKVRFVIDGDEIPLDRAKVFGIVYARRPTADSKPLCRLVMKGGDQLNVKAISWDGKVLKADLPVGASVQVAIEKVRFLDFSLGKIRYLSQMEPREIKYTPFFDITWKYRRDRNLDGGPLRVGNKEYARGLSLHSRTYLRYRIGREFRRFQAVMGIDRVVGRMGDVHVKISGDGKLLFEGDVLGVDEPRLLDLPVSGVRDLEILVDFGGDLDIADHLDLADAKVVK